MVKSQRGRVSLGADKEAFDKFGADLLLLKNATKFFFEQVKTKLTKGEKYKFIF